MAEPTLEPRHFRCLVGERGHRQRERIHSQHGPLALFDGAICSISASTSRPTWCRGEGGNVNQLPRQSRRDYPLEELHRFRLRRTMRFHPRQEEAAGLHTLEWPWDATWVCQANPAHIEIATPAEEKAFAERSRWR